MGKDLENYLFLHRQIEDSAVWSNPHLLKVWIWCLCRASYKRRSRAVRTGVGYTEVTLEPGQFIFGRHKAAEALEMSPSSVWDRMKRLEKLGNINIQSDTHWSIVSVCNWVHYQATQCDDQQAPQQAPDNQATPTPQPADTNNTVIRGKKSNKKKGVKKTTHQEKAEKTLRAVELPERYQTDVGKAAWLTWLVYRSEIKKPLTTRSFKTKVKTAAKDWTDTELEAAVQHSIGEGWTGLFSDSKGVKTSEPRKPIRPKRDW